MLLEASMLVIDIGVNFLQYHRRLHFLQQIKLVRVHDKCCEPKYLSLSF